MPPLKTYIFINVQNELIEIKIKAYYLSSAELILDRIVKDFENYKLKQ